MVRVEDCLQFWDEGRVVLGDMALKHPGVSINGDEEGLCPQARLNDWHQQDRWATLHYA
jgi:hypothetical protein